MSRFSYDNLNEKQLRIAIALLNQEDEVVGVLETAAADAIKEALANFDIIGFDEANVTNGGAAGGARKQTTKRAAIRQFHVAAAEAHAALDKVPLRKSGRKPRLGADQTASRQLQGKYIAAIRSVPKSKRAQFKALVKSAGGRQAAIDAIYAAYPRGN